MPKTIEQHKQAFRWFQWVSRTLREILGDPPHPFNSGRLAPLPDAAWDMSAAMEWGDLPVITDDRVEHLATLNRLLTATCRKIPDVSEAEWAEIQGLARQILDRYEWPTEDDEEVYLLVNYWAEQ